MPSWLETTCAALTPTAAKTLKDNVVHNRSGLPPFRLPQVADQIFERMVAFAQGGDDAPAIALGHTLAQRGLGLRALLALSRAVHRGILYALRRQGLEVRAAQPRSRDQTSIAG
jgi:rsbT co-antagonist protein RsbR